MPRCGCAYPHRRAWMTVEGGGLSIRRRMPSCPTVAGVFTRSWQLDCGGWLVGPRHANPGEWYRLPAGRCPADGAGRPHRRPKGLAPRAGDDPRAHALGYFLPPLRASGLARLDAKYGNSSRRRNRLRHFRLVCVCCGGYTVSPGLPSCGRRFRGFSGSDGNLSRKFAPVP